MLMLIVPNFSHRWTASKSENKVSDRFSFLQLRSELKLNERYGVKYTLFDVFIHMKQYYQVCVSHASVIIWNQ